MQVTAGQGGTDSPVGLAESRAEGRSRAGAGDGRSGTDSPVGLAVSRAEGRSRAGAGDGRSGRDRLTCRSSCG